MGLPWHRHRSCFPVYGSCKHQDLQLCPRPGPPVQADPWDTDPAQVTALIPPTATDTNRTQTHKQLLQALSCGHHNQCCQEMSTVPGSAAVWVPFMGQAASRALRKPQCCPRAMRNTLALRNPHCRIPATPEQHNCCLPVAAPALPPQQSWHTGGGAWYPGVFGKHPSTRSGAPAATPPLPPPAHRVHWVPLGPSPRPGLPTSPTSSSSPSPAATGNGYSGGSS